MTEALPKDLVERVARLLAKEAGRSVSNVARERARKVVMEVLAWGTDTAEKVQELASAIGIATESTEPTPPPAPMTVKAEVEIPLRTVQEAIDVLSRVPWDARLGMAFSGMPEHQGRTYITSEDTYRPRITVRWDEER